MPFLCKTPTQEPLCKPIFIIEESQRIGLNALKITHQNRQDTESKETNISFKNEDHHKRDYSMKWPVERFCLTCSIPVISNSPHE